MASSLTVLDMRHVESVLGMSEGYVLDFTDRTFEDFFEDLGIDIGDPKYCVDGTSKAKRLRRFLRSAEPNEAAKVLKELLEYRLGSGGAAPREETFRPHALREFRNYIHPGAHMRVEHSPDHNSALIAFQVVVGAAEELSRMQAARES